MCLVAVAYVSAAPYDEAIISDSVDAYHPIENAELSKKTLIKAIIIIKAKKIKKHLKG